MRGGTRAWLGLGLGLGFDFGLGLGLGLAYRVRVRVRVSTVPVPCCAASHQSAALPGRARAASPDGGSGAIPSAGTCGRWVGARVRRVWRDAPYDVAHAGVQAGGDAGVLGVHRVHVCARVSASTCPAAATAAEAGEEMW